MAGVDGVRALTEWSLYFLFWLLALLGFLSCRGRRRRRPAMVGELTHMRSMCVGIAETGVDHWSPAKLHKDTFSFIVLLYDQKYQKSSKDFPSLENLPASSPFALFKQPSPSGANIASEPFNRSITMATGSKRSSADSDSLLCHVRLW